MRAVWASIGGRWVETKKDVSVGICPKLKKGPDHVIVGTNL